MADLMRRNARVCHDCRVPLKTEVYVARRMVISAILRDCNAGITYFDKVPLCWDCATPDVGDEGWDERTKTHWGWKTCPGCDRRMFVEIDYIKFCSVRCEQRCRRKTRRNLKIAFCKVCNLGIKARRKDVQFCSNACRQWAYRRRNFAPNDLPDTTDGGNGVNASRLQRDRGRARGEGLQAKPAAA